MADLTPTAANVLRVSGPTAWYKAGGTITAGMAVYRDAADGKVKAAIATSLAAARVIGILLNGGADGQDVEVALPGAIVTLGGGTQDLAYYLSGATAGALSPHTDATTPATGEYGTIVTICMRTSAPINHLVVCAASDAVAA